MGLFAGIEAAKVSEQGSYIRPGEYLLEILGVKVGQTRKREDFFVVKAKVLEATGPTANPVGSDADWMVLLRWDGALGHIKGFCAAACGIDASEVDAAGVEAVVAEPKPLPDGRPGKQPLTGRKVRCTAENVATKTGGTFTRATFRVYNPAAEAAAKATPSAPVAPPPAAPASRMFPPQ